MPAIAIREVEFSSFVREKKYQTRSQLLGGWNSCGSAAAILVASVVELKIEDVVGCLLAVCWLEMAGCKLLWISSRFSVHSVHSVRWYLRMGRTRTSSPLNLVTVSDS